MASQDAEALYRQAANHGDTNALVQLALMREEAGDREGAEVLARQAADQDNTDALVQLALMREEAGERKGAEALARQAADHGYTNRIRREAFAHGKTGPLYRLAENPEFLTRLWPYGLDPDGTPTSAWSALD